MSPKPPATDKPFLISGADRRAMDAWLVEVTAGLSAERLSFDADKDDADLIASEIGTPSMFSPCRLILIKRAEKLKKKDVELLAEAHRTAGGADLLIFRVDDPETKKRSLEALAAVTVPKNFTARGGTDMKKRLEEIFRAGGIEPEDETILALARIATQDPGRALDLAEQCAAAGDSVEASSLLEGSIEVDAFRLADSVFRGDRQSALQGIERLLSAGEDAQRILFLLVRHIRILIAVKGKKRDAASAAAKRYNVFGRFVDDYSAQCKPLDGESLVSCLELCQEADAALKGGSQMTAGQVMSRLIVSLADLARPVG